MPEPQPPMIELTRPSGFEETAHSLLGGLFADVVRLGGAVAGFGQVTERARDLANRFVPDDTPEKSGWRLVYAGLKRAIDDSVKPFHHRAEKPLPIEHLMQIGGGDIDFATIPAPPDFLDQPKSLPLLEQIKPLLREALIYLDVDEVAAKAAADRLPGLFVFALEATWWEHKDGLAALNDLSTSPIALAARQERHWRYYRAHLEHELEKPLFAGDFSLRQLYQPLRGYWIERKDEAHGERREVRHLVDLETALDAWLDQFDPKDTLRVVTGGPGSGKSSFVKWWAWKVLQRETLLPTLILPLHRLDSLDLENEVDKQRKLLRFAKNPLDLESGERRLLLILDGLDELDADDKTGREAASALITKVDRLLERNRHGHQLQIVIAGRELIVSALRGELDRVQQIFHVVGYLPIEKLDNWEGEHRLFEQDQRQAWWQRWGELTGDALEAAPESISGNHQLAELSDQPLLNHLLAVTRARSPEVLSANSSLNTIYAAMLTDVWARSWGDGGKLVMHRRLEKKDFQRLFESVGLAVWQHGGGRSTTLAKVAEIARQERLAEQLSILEKGAKDGALDLLTAFYFTREGSDDTFELTHKSFGEYFAALRLKRLIESEYRKGQDDDHDEAEGLRRWYRWTYAARITPEIIGFLVGELRNLPSEEVTERRKVLVRLFDRSLDKGMPVGEPEGTEKPQHFREAQRFEATAELALLAAISACSAVLIEQTEEQEIEERRGVVQWSPAWPDRDLERRTSAWDMLRRLETGTAFDRVVTGSMQGINLDYQAIRTDLEMADLSFASAKSANLNGVNLIFADLIDANLSGAHLSYADLRRANLGRANLGDAKLIAAILIGVILTSANLSLAYLIRANLSGANLSGANLSGANLSGAYLRGANLSGADLQLVDLRSTRGLTRAQLAAARNVDSSKLPDDLPEE